VYRPRRTRLRIEILEDRAVPAIYTVNTLLDPSIAAGVNSSTGVINGTAGVVTLRSAVEAANHNPGGNTIDLAVAGTYQIQLAPTSATEADNQAGEFAILPTGGSLSIFSTSAGAVAVDGGNLARVFDINPNFDPNNPTPAFIVNFQGFTIQNGRANDPANPDGATSSGGGIRDQGNASLVLINMVVTNNTAAADGGGISMENAVSTPWALELAACTVSNNRAGDAGGGVETDGSGQVIVNACSITGNSAVNQGAGIWLDGIQNPFANGGAVVSATVIDGGSGYSFTVPPAVTFSAPPPGGTTATGTAVVANGVIIGVTITDPGSGYNAPPTITIDPQQSTTQAVVNANVFTASANLTVTGSLISNNTSIAAGQFGGGIGNAGNGNVSIIGSTVADNFTAGSGGGFGDEGNQGSLTVRDSTFAGNSAAVFGGGILEGAPGTTINDSTITGNAAQVSGGGVFVAPATPGNAFTVNNTVLALNVVGPMNFTGGINLNFFGKVLGTGLFVADPLLGPLQDNGGPLAGAPGLQQALLTEAPLPGSPVIDAGFNSAVPVLSGVITPDQRGFNRIVNNRVDIGAVESQPPATMTTLAAAPSPAVSGLPIALAATVTANTPGSNPVQGSVTFSVDGVAVGSAGLSNGVASLTLPALPPGTHTLAATYGGNVLFAASTGSASEVVTPPPVTPAPITPAPTTPTLIPSADVPAGTVLSAPPLNLVTVTVRTVMHHGKKVRHLVVTSNTGKFILGRLVLSGLSLKQYGQLLGLGKQQLQAIPSFDGSPAIDLFLGPNGQQVIDVPAGNGFFPQVVAGL
jgi:hypothetical protein